MRLGIDVVVVAYGSRDLLPSCLLAATSIPHLANVVVIDHGTDGSAEVARSMGAEAACDPSNPGFGAGQNRGVRLGTAPFLLLLNPDAIIEPHSVANGIRAFADPRVAVVQGAVVGPDGKLERSQGRALGPLHLVGRALHLRPLLGRPGVQRLVARMPILGDTADRAVATPTEVAALAATAILVRRSCFETVGGFDERYFLYGEDLDLGRRLRDAGYRLVALPGSWARHQSGASSTSSWSRELQWWAGTLSYAIAWWSGPALVVAALASLVVWARLVIARPASWRLATTNILSRPWVVGRAIRRQPAPGQGGASNL